MSKLNIEELLGCLQEAAIVVKSISERQHIDNLSSYFDDDGNPIMRSFNIDGKSVKIPLFVLADHTSIGLDSLEFDFETRLLPDSTSEPSELKRSLLPFLKRKFGKRRKKGGEIKHNVGNLTVDSQAATTWYGGEKKSGMAKIKVVFKKDEKPEAVSRLVDELIRRLDYNPE
jgi:hypothetical protein